MLNGVLVFGNRLLGLITWWQRKQIDQENHRLIQTFACRGAIKRRAEQSFNVNRPESDRHKEPVIQFLEMIEIGVIGPAEAVKFSNQISAVFEPVIGQLTKTFQIMI